MKYKLFTAASIAFLCSCDSTVDDVNFVDNIDSDPEFQFSSFFNESTGDRTPLSSGSTPAAHVNADGEGNVSIELTGDGDAFLRIANTDQRFAESLGPSTLEYSLEACDEFDNCILDAGILIETSVTPLNNLKIKTDRGNDSVILDFDTVIGGNLEIDTRNGNDGINIYNMTINGKMIVRTRGGEDLFQALDVTTGAAYIGTGPGDNDILAVINTRFQGRASFSGGNGSGDLFGFSNQNTYDRAPIFSKLELSQNVDEGEIKACCDNLVGTF